MGEHGAVARVVVSNPTDCPAINVGGTVQSMTVRLPVPVGLRPACELAIPTGTSSAASLGQQIALPHSEPARVVVIGDTGCRVKGVKVQDCNDPAKWPFARVASGAATTKPDLVIHVGDYLYREEPCPVEAHESCGGTAAGDTWEAWNADFFAPARDLLMSSVWVFARGNHESCDRSWRGWFYYLDPRPFTNRCEAYTVPYPVRLGLFEAVIFDSSAASDKETDQEAVQRYASELATIRTSNSWLILHHPLWGLKIAATAAPGSLPTESPTEVTAAWEQAPVKGIDLIVSGHTHLFELLTFDNGRPPQLVAGDGGTEMANDLGTLGHLKLRGATLLSSEDAREFGFTSIVHSGSGWKLTLTDTAGHTVKTATLTH